MHNKKLNISPAWVFRTDTDELFEPVLFRLLASIRDTSKLTVAAAAVGISYRHAWNLLNRAADILGMPLVIMRKGHGSQLSALGEKLLWAEHRVSARLGPQIDSMAAELNDQIQQLLAGSKPTLRLHASHGYAVALLPEFSEQANINLQYRNPEEALSALNRGECDIASFHLPTCPSLARQIIRHYKKHLYGHEHRLIRFVTRREGLMMRKGEHENIRTLQDLSTSGLSFISRDRHSGTRILFDLLLKQQEVAGDSINRTSQQEFTHTAIAAFVASGMAEVGFGVQAAAEQFGLNFIEMAEEHYMLIYRQDRLPRAALEELKALMKTPALIDRINSVPGYDPDSPGEITTFDALPGRA
ncbi:MULTISPECIES: substrate-binding domain-containing protein [unclassified Marinobacter]|uniref:helix-turn-helix transcriptional regulator n=1 Tax=unclassified Marinobacter TaxID=83889 RepID=UPI0026E41B42|nr:MULTISPECIES: substrate-binding domain-containing protein [unclassified Marinobacter]MDO6441898.1 substrate-binding domain-containing protein [Marinobacter sp. 2_MG-2023]MDO6824717.1 substrate-binding domain-containing protein [Marinobacter sp. 1_MG-2023]